MEEEIDISDRIRTNYDCRIIENKMEPFTLYLAKDICKILNLKNIHKTVRDFNNDYKLKISTHTKGGNQNMIYLTYKGLKKLIASCRNSKSIEFAEIIGIDIHKTKIVPIEINTIECIKKAFAGYNMINQYSVLSYKIDLYFIDYKIAIECDEYHHIKQIEEDKKRENKIKEELGCDFIRYKPQTKEFDIFSLINEIMKKINTYTL